MSITCPQCSYVNPDQSGFCVRCGTRLRSGSQPTGASSPSAYAAPVSAPSTPPSYQPSQNSSASYGTQSMPAQIGSGQGMASIRRAFAGHGIPIMHYSWLLNGDQAQAMTIRSNIRDMLKLRDIPRLNVNLERLIERGILMEEREYLTVSRGVATVFIYVTPAGRDLYISRATTVLPAISGVRVAILSLLLLIMFLGFVIHPSGYSLLTGDLAGFIFASTLTVLSIPILLFLLWLLIRSFISWLVEKDFWEYLRPNTLNDFQLDDIALLEHVTDDVVHSAVEQAGLDASKITPPPLGYQPKRRFRAI
jgi:hypothetical protein